MVQVKKNETTTVTTTHTLTFSEREWLNFETALREIFALEARISEGWYFRNSLNGIGKVLGIDSYSEYPNKKFGPGHY